MAQARVLLVEDDPLLRRFVRMALEPLLLDVLECDSVASAIQILASNPVHLILTDLTLPDASGVDLLLHLQVFPDLRGQAKVVVLSGGLTPAVKRVLAPLQVWHMLEKPVSISVLEQCVKGALAEAQLAAAPLANVPNTELTGTLPTSLPTAFAPYFGGDTALFQLYRSTCLAQFPDDISAGDNANANHDTQALRRVAHNLKSVFLILHLPALAAQARALEQACQTAQPDTVDCYWLPLRSALVSLIKNQAITHAW